MGRRTTWDDSSGILLTFIVRLSIVSVPIRYKMRGDIKEVFKILYGLYDVKALLARSKLTEFRSNDGIKRATTNPIKVSCKYETQIGILHTKSCSIMELSVTNCGQRTEPKHIHN